jgi:hypothetical protein
MKSTVIGAALGLVLSAVAVSPASAGSDDDRHHGRNVGTVHDVSGVIPDGLVSDMFGGDMVPYTCDSVHETQHVIGVVAQTGKKGFGYQDKQTCKLAAGSPLPTRPTTYRPGDCWHPTAFKDAPDAYFSWFSDYQYYANGALVTADNVVYTITPSGTVHITSFYADAADCPAV